VKIKIAVAVCLPVTVLLLAIGSGTVSIPPLDIARIISHSAFGTTLPDHITQAQVSIVWALRLPRALLAFLVGAALSVSGAIMQSVLRNPLASSFTLGVASGASLGAALVIFLGVALPVFSILTLPVLGFTFALATIILVIAISARLDMRMENHTIILMGMVFSLFVNAVTTLLFALFREGAQRMIFWQMGSFARGGAVGIGGWDMVFILTPVAIAGFLLAYRYTWEMDVMSFGEEQAQAIGVNTKNAKRILLVLGAALTGSSIAFVGTIGFVDLVAPHVVRKIYGSSHKYVIPMSAITGGSFMVLADLVARTVLPHAELPVGVITALIGAPFFAYIYFSKRRS
jgi:iron complex transport system permease protein